MHMVKTVNSVFDRKTSTSFQFKLANHILYNYERAKRKNWVAMGLL